MITFASLFPDLQPAVRHIAETAPALFVKANFPHIQITHLLSLFLLGGCVILINLRLVGAGLDEPPSRVARRLGLLLHLSVAGVLVSGVAITMAIPVKLYMDPAFLVKMLGLFAGLVATYGASLPVARAEGVVSRASLAAFAVAIAVWLLAVWLFAFTLGTSPGVIHVIFAAGLILLVGLRGRSRWAFVGGLSAILAAQQVVTHAFIDPYDLAVLDPVNKAFTWAEAIWILGFVALAVTRAQTPATAGGGARLIGVCTILIWVTVAAAGRWIAFG